MKKLVIAAALTLSACKPVEPETARTTHQYAVRCPGMGEFYTHGESAHREPAGYIVILPSGDSYPSSCVVNITNVTGPSIKEIR